MTIAVLKKLRSAIPWCEPEIREQTVELALEIAREGREGRRTGTLFTPTGRPAIAISSRSCKPSSRSPKSSTVRSPAAASSKRSSEKIWMSVAPIRCS
jgi:DNA integrity scanning protein DisA with diadenylate cyclase activity